MYGYSPKLPLLLDEVTRDWGDRSFWESVPQNLLENCQERLVRSLKSCKSESPFYTLSPRLTLLTQNKNMLERLSQALV